MTLLRDVPKVGLQSSGNHIDVSSFGRNKPGDLFLSIDGSL